MHFTFQFSFFNSLDENAGVINEINLQNHNIQFSCNRNINFQAGPNQRIETNVFVLTSRGVEDDLKLNTLYNAILNLAMAESNLYMEFKQIDENNEVGYVLSRVKLTDVRAMFSDDLGMDAENSTRTFVSNLHFGFIEG